MTLTGRRLQRCLRVFGLAFTAGVLSLIAVTQGVSSAPDFQAFFVSPPPPTVAIAITSAGPYWNPATITISATPVTPGGSATKVEFFEGDKLLAQDLSSPFVFTWNGVSTGNYNIRARVTDNQGQTAWSNVINFSVAARPAISITSPSQSAGIATGKSITLAATATDSDGTVVKVDYFDGAAPIGSSTDSANFFTALWPTPPAGAHTLIAIATDDDGNTMISPPVSIFVGPPPVVTFTVTSPDRPAGPPFAPGDQVVVTVVVGLPPPAVPPAIANVGLWEGGELLGDLTLPIPTYTFSAVGYPRKLEARVRDVNGVETRTPISIAVNSTLRSDGRVINGINVGQTKLFDERSLALMLQSMQSNLANRDFFDQSSIAAAINKFQGARIDSSSLGISVTGTPLPGITTVTNSATPGTTQTITQAAIPEGSPTPAPATTTITTNAPATTQQTVTQPAITPAPPQLPTQNTSFNFQPTFDQAPQTLLAKQMAMNYEIANLRLLLQGAISDRMFVQPISIGSDTITNHTTRARAIVGFRISLDSLKIYKKAVAQVEITIRTRGNQALPSSMQGAPSLVSLVPMESNFNVATISKNAKQFGLGVAVQPISFGLATEKTKEQLYLIQDQDVVSFEGRRSTPVDQVDDSDAVTFGWQFRPVLGQEVVRAGPRQVYASLALPASLNDKFVGSVEVHTYWREYDSKRKTVGPVIPGSDSYEWLKDLVVDSKLHGQPLIPRVTNVKYQNFGAGNVLVWVKGENFLPGTQVVVNDERLSGAHNGLFIQGEQDLFFVVPAASLALSEQPRIIGQFGPPVPICQDLLQPNDDTVCVPQSEEVKAEASFGLKVTNVHVTPIDMQTSSLTILISSMNNAFPKINLEPVVLIGQTVYGIGGNVVESRRNGKVLELVLDVPTQVLRNARKIVVKELFGGKSYTDEVSLRNNPLVTMPDDFTATSVAVLRADDKQADLVITGTNFSSSVHVIVGDEDVPLLAVGATCSRANGTLTAPCLRKTSDSLLLLHVPATKFTGMKQVIVQQGVAQPSILSLAPSPAVIPKPKVVSIESISVNDENEVNITGTDLTSVEKVVFRGLTLIFESAKDGQSGKLRVTKDLSDSPGSKALDFVSKDGSKVTSTIIVNARSK